jgi:putative ABC transport system permease protein
MGQFGLLIGLVQQTFANVYRHRLRCFLTMFGIAWGIASLVMMSALCDGFRQGQRKSMAQLGNNLVLMWNGRTEKQAGGQRAGRRVYWDSRDVQAIREQCPSVSTVEGEVKREAFVVSEYNSGRFLVDGVTPQYLQLRNFPLGSGRHVSAGDQSGQRRVAVLGNSVREQLFGKRRDVLGRRVIINNYPYTVIGLLSAKNQNSSYDGWDNDKVLIPQSSLLQDSPPDSRDYRPGRMSPIVFRPASVKEWDRAVREVRTVLARRHDFDSTDEGATPMWNMVKDAEVFDKAFNGTEIFLAVVSIITLSLGGIGVMNTMMSAVAERTNEIGLRKAVGATKRRILVEFMLEGLLLAFASGALGLGAVTLLAAGVNSLPMPDMFSGLPISYSDAYWAFLALGTVAVGSALPPAWRACQMTPVEALREER